MSEPVIIRPEAGGQIVRPAGEAEAVLGLLGGTEVSDESVGAAARQQAYRETFDNLENWVLTAAEGVLDMATLGIVRETGEEADIRREVNAGAALLGNAVGALLPYPKLPVHVVTRAGESFGKRAARALVKDAERSVIARGMTEAGAGAAVMGAQSLGHHVMEAVIEDKDFAMEAVLDEAKLGGVLGLGTGTILGILPKLANRSSIKAQGGFSGDAEPVRWAWRDAVDAYDGVIQEHAARIEAIREMRKEGVLNAFADDILPKRQAALLRAQRAREALRDVALPLDADPKLWAQFQRQRDELFDAVDELDRVMRPSAAERAPVVQLRPGTTLVDTPLGPRFAAEIDDSPTLLEAQPAGAMAADRLARAENVTAVGKRRPALPEPESSPSSLPESPPSPVKPESPAPPIQKEATPEVLQELMPANTVWDWKAGRQMLPEHLDEILEGARVIYPHPQAMAADNMLHGDFTNQPLLKLRNGWFFPPATIEANAEYFVKKFPDVVDPKIRRELKQQGLREPEKLPDPPTVVEAVPAAQINAVVDAAAKREAEAAARAAEKAQKAAEREAARQARAAEASVKKAQKAAERAPTIVEDTAPTIYDVPPDVKRAAAQKLLDDWIAAFRERPAPLDFAAARVQNVLDNLRKVSGGRLDSAVAVRFAEGAGIRPSSHPFGSALDQVWAMRRVGKMAADESRGVVTPIREGLQADLGALGIGLVADSPLMALAARYVGFGARAAAAAGRLMAATTRAAERFLTAKRVRAVTWAAQNRPYVYSDRGPIEDPVERIEEIRRLALNPAAIEARVEAAAEDLATVHPELVQMIKVKTQTQLAALAAAAPQIQYDATGRPLSPPAGEMRRFLEFENAIHDLQGILKAVEAGSPSPAQIRALQQGWPSVHARLVSTMLNPDVVRRLSRARLRAVEAITGLPLTNASDPAFIQRQVQAWVPPAPPQPMKPQAFNINPEPATPAASLRTP